MRANLAIVTVIPPELHAGRAAFGLSGPPTKVNPGTNYWYGTIETVRMGKVSIALCVIGLPGNLDAAAVTTEIIQQIKPKFAILVGIAAGLREKTKIGNVVISDQIVAYEKAAVERRGRKFSRPDAFRAPHSAIQDVNYYATLKRDNIITDFLTRIHGPPPKATRSNKAQFARFVASQVSVQSATIGSRARQRF